MSTDFRPGRPAAEVDLALRGAVDAYDRARRNVALWFTDALERRLYRELGHASMEIYARQGLGFSPGRTRQFLALAQKLRGMPHLRAAVTEGRLGWTKAQEVSRVVTPATEKPWVDKAVELPRQELRREIADARKTRTATVADPPTTIAIQLDGLQLARFEASIAAAKKSGAVAATASRADAVLAGVAALTENPQRVRRRAPAATVIVQRCPDCESAFALTGQGPKRLDAATLAALACDHVARDASGHNRSAIPPAIRRRVLDRDRHHCTAPGCSNSQFLDVHHLVPREQGGANTLENMTTLCTRCHRHAHREPG